MQGGRWRMVFPLPTWAARLTCRPLPHCSRRGVDRGVLVASVLAVTLCQVVYMGVGVYGHIGLVSRARLTLWGLLNI